MTWYVVALVFHLSGDVDIKVLQEPSFDSYASCADYVESTPNLGIELLINDVTRLRMKCMDDTILGIKSI